MSLYVSAPAFARLRLDLAADLNRSVEDFSYKHGYGAALASNEVDMQKVSERSLFFSMDVWPDTIPAEERCDEPDRYRSSPRNGRRLTIVALAFALGCAASSTVSSHIKPVVEALLLTPTVFDCACNVMTGKMKYLATERTA